MNALLEYYEGNGITLDELYAFVKDCIEQKVSMNTPILFTKEDDNVISIKSIYLDIDKIILKESI